MCYRQIVFVIQPQGLKGSTKNAKKSVETINESLWYDNEINLGPQNVGYTCIKYTYFANY